MAMPVWMRVAVVLVAVVCVSHAMVVHHKIKTNKEFKFLNKFVFKGEVATQLPLTTTDHGEILFIPKTNQGSQLQLATYVDSEKWEEAYHSKISCAERVNLATKALPLTTGLLCSISIEVFKRIISASMIRTMLKCGGWPLQTATAPNTNSKQI